MNDTGAPAGEGGWLDAGRVQALSGLLDAWRVNGSVSEAALIDQLAALEVLGRRVAAVQARVAAAFDTAHRARRAAAGVPRADLGVGVGTQVGLARRVSPHRGNTLAGLGTALTQQMPYTLAALHAGTISEYAAIRIVAETATLSTADRSHVDARLAALFTPGVSDRSLQHAARALAYQIDPENHVRRIAKARTQRRVTTRPAPDTMAYLTALLPVEDAAAIIAALHTAAATARATGDSRTTNQVIADTLIERTTGYRASQHSITAPEPHLADEPNRAPATPDTDTEPGRDPAPDPDSEQDDRNAHRRDGDQGGDPARPGPNGHDTTTTMREVSEPDSTPGTRETNHERSETSTSNDTGTSTCTTAPGSARGSTGETNDRPSRTTTSGDLRAGTSETHTARGTGETADLPEESADLLEANTASDAAPDDDRNTHASGAGAGTGGAGQPRNQTADSLPRTSRPRSALEHPPGCAVRPWPPVYRPGDVLPGYGPSHPSAGHPAPRTGPTQRPPIELHVVISDTALFNGGTTPALLNGEPLPAWLARNLLTDPDTRVRLRRLYTNTHGQLVARDSHSRTFT